jgi:hypothetical protein
MIEKIQKEDLKDHKDLNDETLEEIAKFVKEKPYKNKNDYYPPKLLAQIIPECYTNIPFKLDKFSNYSEETLFYIFYAFPCEEIQIKAYDDLLQREFAYSKLHKNFMTLGEEKTADNKKHTLTMFDPFIWSKVTREILFDEKFISTLEYKVMSISSGSM